MVKGKDVGTISSIDGSFSLNLSEEDNEIVASFVGFISQEVSVGNQSIISSIWKRILLSWEKSLLPH